MENTVIQQLTYIYKIWPESQKNRFQIKPQIKTPEKKHKNPRWDLEIKNSSGNTGHKSIKIWSVFVLAFALIDKDTQAKVPSQPDLHN